MRFLPVVDRELREGSRRRGTYWLRVRVAVQALLIGVAAYVVNWFFPKAAFGAVLFWGLSGVAMLFCLLAGRRSTADCLSQEKREGTLGLLFLTDLKGYDVVLGKMAATSISSFYALMAIFPVMAIPLLMGGMTSGFFWRMVLVLMNTFFFSLAIGIFASAVSREYRTAMAVNFYVVLLVVGVPVALGAAFSGVGSLWFCSCPILSFLLCGDISHPGVAHYFWESLAVTHGLAWVLTLLACWIVPRTWGDRPAPAPSSQWRWRDLARRLSYGDQAKGAAFRQKALDVNAFYWLAARARLKPAQVWIFVGMAVFWWIHAWITAGAYLMDIAIFTTTFVIINATLKLWITTEAGQRLGEDRRSGAFEWLLATPLTVDDVLRGQILALRRQFLKPLLLVTALELVLTILLHRGGKTLDFITCLAGVAILWADALALSWVSMAAALTCKNQTQAISFAVARILILPWVAFGAVMTAINILDWLGLIRWQPGDRFGLGAWFVLGLAVDLFFGLSAWHKLRKNFRQLAVQSFLPEPPRPSWWALWRTATRKMGQLFVRRVPARARKPVLTCLAAGVALAAVLLLRPSQPHFPPPVLVSITQSNAPFRVFPGGGSGVFFIMPDGTLWRWGKPGAPQSPRSVVPEQVGDAHDWVKVVGAGTHCLGLRADGSIWAWGFSNGKFCPDPQPAIEGQDWIDLGTGQHFATAVKRDGTLWTWNEPLVANEGHARRRNDGPESHWTAVYCGNESVLALRKDGTLWAGGTIWKNMGGRPAIGEIIFPTLLCAETNWIALDANGLARNQAGELWDVANALPDPQAGASAVCSMVSSNGASGHVYSVPSQTRAQIRSNGTLWTVQLNPSSAFAPSAEDWRQLGPRSDWVAVWGYEGTGFGLTADGTVWTWGVELDKEPVKTYESRLEVLRDRLTGRATPTARRMSLPTLAQPRPLLRLVGGPANSLRK